MFEIKQFFVDQSSPFSDIRCKHLLDNFQNKNQKFASDFS